MAGNHVLKVSLLTDDSQFTKGMQQAEGGVSNFGKTALKVFGVVGVVQLARKALTAVKDFAADSIRAYSDLEESLNAVNVTYGKHADGVKKLGEESARAVGLSNSQFNTYAVSLANFAQTIAGEAGDVVGTVDTLTKRVADFASVMNLDVGEAMGKFQSGLAGQSKPLREFGIDVSDANVKAFALANGIGEVGKELTEAEKVQARYGTIMKQTAKVHNDFANTSDSLANRQRILNAELENSKAVLGQALAPAKLLFQGMQNWGIKAITEVATSLNVLFGTMSQAEGIWARYERAIQSGTKETEAFEDAVTSLGTNFPWIFAGYDRIVEHMREFIWTSLEAGKTTEEIRQAIRLAGDEAKWSAGKIEKMQQAVEDVGVEHREVTGEVERFKNMIARTVPAVAELTDEYEENTEAVEENTKSHKDNASELRAQTDDVFNLARSLEKQTEAQDAVNEAVKKHKEGSPEHLAALRDLAEAGWDVAAAEARMADNGRLTREEFIKQQTAMGLTREQAELLAGAYDKAFANRTGTGTYTTVFKQQGKPPETNVPVFHKGGRFKAPSGSKEGLAILQDGETVLPADIQPGSKAPGGGGGSAGANYYSITVNALDPATAADAVVQALQEFERTNGAIPIDTRTM